MFKRLLLSLSNSYLDEDLDKQQTCKITVIMILIMTINSVLIVLSLCLANCSE